MKQHTIGYRLLRILTCVLYFFLTFGIGYGVAAALRRSGFGALRTIPLVVCFLISLGLQSCFHTVGHWIFGKLSGFRLISVSFLKHTHVREKDKIITRLPLPETLLTTCLMAPVQSTSHISYTLYWLGGTICNLIVGLLALLIMMLLRWPLDGLFGCFSFSLFQAGIWLAFLNALPMYQGCLPNDGLKAWQLKRNPQLRRVFTKNLRILSWLSQAKLPLDQIPESLLIEEPYETIDVFTALLMLRQYELLLWRGSRREASRLLAQLYQNQPYLPEEWQLRITLEALFMLAAENQDPNLLRELMTPERRRQYEELHSPESLRCLFAWSIKTSEGKEAAPAYESAAVKEAGRVAFRPAAEAWKRMIAECRWSTERSDIDLL